MFAVCLPLYWRGMHPPRDRDQTKEEGNGYQPEKGATSKVIPHHLDRSPSTSRDLTDSSSLQDWDRAEVRSASQQPKFGQFCCLMMSCGERVLESDQLSTSSLPPADVPQPLSHASGLSFQLDVSAGYVEYYGINKSAASSSPSFFSSLPVANRPTDSIVTSLCLSDPV